MPHSALKLVPGVDQNRTPALNEAAISESQLIRFIPDRNGLGLPQKLGGWVRFFDNTISSIVRCLWAWSDINTIKHLAIGAEQSLNILTNGNLLTVTPRQTIANVAVSFNTTDGSDVVEIDDTGSNITMYDSVFIETQVSVGGLVLYGLYQCYAISANKYSILATDVLGNPQYATATVSTGGAVATFETASGSSLVEVVLADHGLVVGGNFVVFVSLTIGGITLQGNYNVTEVVDPDTFTIQASNSATSSAGPTSINSGDVRFLYYIALGPLPVGTGYGIGGYGMGGYGTGIPPQAEPGTAITNIEDWTLDNWGQILIANPYNEAIYTWDPATNQTVAAVIPQGPITNRGIFVAMPQRQIVAWGSTFNGIYDPLLIRWCEVEDYSIWIGNITNQAGSYRLPRGSEIVGGLQGPQQGLLWTDLALWAMQYTGPPFIYGFNEIGTGCGLIGRKAAGVLNGVVYWMSQSQFFQFAGDGVKPIMCPIWDVIFQDLDQDNLDKIRVAPNSRFNEISWYYPTTGSGEINKYVKYNATLNQWDYGTLARTAWINQSVFGPPIGAGTDQYLYQHEVGNNAGTSAMSSSFQTGYFALNEADVKQFVDQVWPDMKWGDFGGTQAANVLITFYTADYAGQTPIAYGPFTLTQATTFVTPRFRARLMSIKIESNDIDSFWRLGNIRYRSQIDGKF